MARAPLVLIVSQHEWASRSLGSVIAPKGYAVLRSYTAEQAIEAAAQNNPDAVFIDLDLPHLTGTELARQLIDQEAVSRSAPVLLLATGHVTRERKLEALEAGVWDILSLPIDAEELLLRIERYIRGKLESDRLQDDALIDALTGLYSWHGISRRLAEVAAAASRYGRPLSCIVVNIGDETGGGRRDDAIPAQITDVARQLRSMIRTSDLLARIGPNEFAVVAPDTPGQGAEILATRLRKLSNESGSAPRFRAGVYAVDDFHSRELDPSEFLTRATRASYENIAN